MGHLIAKVPTKELISDIIERGDNHLLDNDWVWKKKKHQASTNLIGQTPFSRAQ